MFVYLKREKGEGRLCYENQYRVEGNTSPFFFKRRVFGTRYYMISIPCLFLGKKCKVLVKEHLKFIFKVPLEIWNISTRIYYTK